MLGYTTETVLPAVKKIVLDEVTYPVAELATLEVCSPKVIVTPY